MTRPFIHIDVTEEKELTTAIYFDYLEVPPELIGFSLASALRISDMAMAKSPKHAKDFGIKDEGLLAEHIEAKLLEVLTNDINQGDAGERSTFGFR